MPDHAAAPVAGGPRRLDDGIHRLLHGMELVVAGQDLVDLPRVRVLLEGDEVPQQRQQPLLIEHAADQHFQFQDRRRGQFLARDGPPDLEPLLVGRQRADAGLQPVRDDQGLVVVEERGDLLLVGLQLLPGFPDRGVLVGRVLQFDHAQRQAVDEDHDVGPAVVLALDDRELIDRQPVVVGRVVVVDELHPVPGDRAVLAAILDLHAIPQHPVEGPVGPDERRRVDAEDFAEGLLAGLVGNVGVDPVDGFAQAADENHVAKGLPARRPARRGRFPGRGRSRIPVPRTRTGRLLRRWIR